MKGLGYFKKGLKVNKWRKEKVCLKERQRRVVGPKNENHEVKIIIKKLEKHKGNVEKSAWIV